MTLHHSNSYLQNYTSQLSNQFKKDRLIENRISYNIDQAELSIYETMEPCKKVALDFESTVIASMIQGKKIMHLNKQSFEFLPGESLVMPAGSTMLIDFPEAALQQPTRCLTLTISSEQIQKVLSLLNEYFPKAEEKDSWNLDTQDYHLLNNFEIASTLIRIVRVFSENNQAKSFFAANAVQELLVRLMQCQARKTLIEDFQKHLTAHRLAFAISYIKENLHRQISVAVLCEKACMSKPHFFRCFKAEFGITPVEYVNRERINLAKKVLHNPLKSITDACFAAGFNSVNYFIKVFKQLEGLTPKLYKEQVVRKLS